MLREVEVSLKQAQIVYADERELVAVVAGIGDERVGAGLRYVVGEECRPTRPELRGAQVHLIGSRTVAGDLILATERLEDERLRTPGNCHAVAARGAEIDGVAASVDVGLRIVDVDFAGDATNVVYSVGASARVPQARGVSRTEIEVDGVAAAHDAGQGLVQIHC